MKYADATVSPTPPPVKFPENVIALDGEKAIRSVERTFIGVSRARELLFEPVRKMLAELQAEAKFRVVKMHSIFDDDMMVYSEFDGKPHYNFNLLDNVFDFLLSINLKPFVQLSFMPSALAAQKDKTTFYANVITSPPKDINRWNCLVDKFVRHLIDRYGKSEVESWPFAVWNEPFTSQKIFGFAKGYYSPKKESGEKRRR